MQAKQNAGNDPNPNRGLAEGCGRADALSVFSKYSTWASVAQVVSIRTPPVRISVTGAGLPLHDIEGGVLADGRAALTLLPSPASRMSWVMERGTARRLIELLEEALGSVSPIPRPKRGT